MESKVRIFLGGEQMSFATRFKSLNSPEFLRICVNTLFGGRNLK